MKGKKLDKGKDMWHLLPFKEMDDVIKVLTFGAQKYGENDWQAFIKKNINERRYFSAALRHLSAWKKGELSDEETGLPHLAHVVCCMLFIMWRDNEKKSNHKK